MLTVGAAIGISATAQTSAPTDAQPEAKPGVDQVVVTAARRSQLLSDVAGSVTAMSGLKLEQLGMETAEDVFKLSPGVQFNKGNADGALYSIRGIGTNTSSDNVVFGQAPTGIYIDDIPFTDPYVFISSPDIAPFDLERVEVLRGPQGALYGSSSLGGAVRYLFNKPNLDNTEFSVMSGFSSVAGGGNGYTANTMANLPLSKGVAALRMVLTSRKDAGYVDNLGTGRNDINANRADAGRAILALKPMQGLDITATYMTQRSRQDGTSAVSPSADSLTVDTPTDAHVKSRVTLADVQVNWERNGLRLTSITGYQTKRRDQVNDVSYLLVPDFTMYGGIEYPNVDRAINDEPRHSNSFTQEFRLASAHPDRLDWLIGAFHQKANFFRGQSITLPGANDPENLPGDEYFATVRTGTAVENSLFADLDWKATPQWSLGAGARYFKTKVDFDRSNYGAPFTHFSDSDNGVTPKFSTRYAFTPAVSVYATASRGYRFGGINTVGLLPYKSDSLWNYETGVRLQPNRDLNLSLSGFVLDWKDIQVSSADSNGFVIISNVGKAKSTGLEATFGWRASQALRINGSLAYTDATIRSDFVSASGVAVDSGTRLPGVAKLQTTLDGSYNFAGPMDTQGTFTTVLQYVGSRRAQMDAGLVLPGYTTADLRLNIRKDNWELSAYVQNAADKRGQSSAALNYSTYLNPGTVNYTEWYPIRPRTVGMSLRYDY
ncbi:TonB-dependent receptor [Duganella aceris]|uniref:TonB-dependent receptor n=1 Tax=Duganella aceris TaxID=2703883 RepID=A0ABX0FKW6_9BURK|nr:TonB-dependent receptor [Duganella aceris]NGZ85169.1 TonB-dependent receptor [Duganella aceris]